MRRWLPALAGAALAACAAAPEVAAPTVLIPPPSAPRGEFFIDKVQAQSRETGAEAWQRNETYARALSDQLKDALRAADKGLAPPPADRIRPRLYLAYAPVTSSAKGGRRADAYVEVRLELVDAAGAVLYATHTRTIVKRAVLAKDRWSPEADELIRATLARAAQDFVSRL